jgi:hypothetical protein
MTKTQRREREHKRERKRERECESEDGNPQGWLAKDGGLPAAASDGSSTTATDRCIRDGKSFRHSSVLPRHDRPSATIQGGSTPLTCADSRARWARDDAAPTSK